MQIILNTEECGGFVRYLPVKELDRETRDMAEKAFDGYKQRGVVKEGGFTDNLWLLSDELQSKTVSFYVDELLFTRNTKSWIGCTSECYQECAHAYIAFQLGKYTLSYIQLLAKAIRSLAGMTMEEACAAFDDEKQQMAAFLALIPESNDLRDQVVEELEEWKWKKERRGHRQLPDFKYYLRFNQALDQWWGQAAPGEKIFYFPVYFWWHLTAILPLRATEFLTTPRNCIREDPGRYILTVRRTRMKKGKRAVSYTIDRDYEKKEYEIPEWLYKEIKSYVDMTKGCELPAIGTLLVPERSVPSGYFTYIQISHRLKKFCREVMDEADFPIHVGDTRHLAMISLILSGGSPVVCRELAGHESIDISSNYYANLSSVVESVIYEKYHGYSGDVSLGGSLKFPPSLPENRSRVSGGWCNCPGVEEGDVSECLKTYGNGGKIGECIDCTHFYPDDAGLRLSIEKDYKKKVDEDGQYLMQMIELVRKGLGYQEDIGAAMLRLQGSSYRYGMTLMKKNTEDDRHGKTQKD